MCGICGIILKKDIGSWGKAESGLRAMMDSLRHRGPDDGGEFLDRANGILLGHRRLSIIDLSSAGKQPFVSEDGLVITISNGEIYNYKEIREHLEKNRHRFVSHSDNEVMLHLFEEKGADMLKDLRGMYAVAVYDRRSGDVFLARDELGIKPLYIFENDDMVAFSSEIGAFYVIGADLEPEIEGFVDFLMLGSIPAPHTYIRNVRALLPGQKVRIHKGCVNFDNVHPISSWLAESAGSEEPDVGDLCSCIRDSVSRHLISDAPVGVFLSGGIDSGTLAGIASEVSNASIHTLVVTLPGESLDEAVYARKTAEHYGTSHTEVPLTQDNFEKDLPLFLSHLDMPSIDGFNSFVVSRAAKESGLTVALSGLGGDELFCGYPTFPWVPFFGGVQKGLGFAGGGVGRRIGAAVLSRLCGSSGAQRVAELLGKYPGDRRIGYLAYRGLFVGRFLEEILADDISQEAGQTFERYMDETRWVASCDLSSSGAVAGLELSRYMCSQLLRDTDAMSMAHSLEIRVPLVDRQVVKKALAFMSCKTRKGDGRAKWLLRQAVQKPLPHDIVNKRKQGFVFPWQKWMSGKVMTHLDGMLEDTDCWKMLLKKDIVNKWKNGYEAGHVHWSCIWGLYVAMIFLAKLKGVSCYNDVVSRRSR